MSIVENSTFAIRSSTFSLFVSFFPQLVAGPIVRAADFLPQLQQLKRVEFQASSLFLFLRGLVKKIIIADNLGMFADRVFENPEAWPSAIIWVATIWLFHSNLLRFFWLYGHGNRRGEDSRISPTAQFRSSVLCYGSFDVLEEMAYFAFILAERLPIHSAWWQSSRRCSALSQPDDDDALGWPLAWGQLELRPVGIPARRRARRPSRIPAKRERKNCRSWRS